MAAYDVRAIQADELVDWVRALHVAFHVERAAAADEEAAFRRDVVRNDPRRMLAAFDGHRIAGTLYGYTAELTMPGGTCVAANAITAATVLPTHRRRGLLRRMLTAELRAARERGDLASILIAAEYPIYGRFGFGPATEQVTYTLDTRAVSFTRRAAGHVELVAPETLSQLAPGLFDQFRRGQPGQIDRPAVAWELLTGLRQAPWAETNRAVRCAVFRAADAGGVQGYVVYRVDGTWQGRLPTGKLEIVELIACSPDAYLGLWRYCCEVDLVAQATAGMRCVDEPLSWLLDDARAAVHQTLRSDLLWLRPLDVAGLLAARRYLSEGRLVLEVDDPLALSSGRFVLDGGPDGAACRSTDESADLSLSAQTLGAIVLGGLSLTLLADAGAIDELRPGALSQGERLFRWPVAPWCSTFF